MKFFSALFLLFILSYPLNAQQPKAVPLDDARVKAEWSPIKKGRKSIADDLIGYDARGGYYTLEVDKFPTLFNWKGEYSIRHYGADFLPTSGSINITSKEGEGWTYFKSFETHGGSVYLFTETSIAKEKKNTIHVQTFDENLQPKGERRLLSEIPYMVNDRGTASRISSNSNFFGSTLSVAGFRLITSSFNSKILLFKNYTYDHILKNEDKNEKYELQMLNAEDDLSEMWKVNIEMPYPSSTFEVLDGTVDEEGNFYMIGVLYSQKRKTWDKDKKPTYEYKLLKVNEQGKAFEITVKSADKFLTDLSLYVTPNGDLACTGFYSNDKNTRSINGVYYISLDSENGATKKESFKEFELDFITENMSDGEARRTERRAEKGKDVNLKEFKFDYLIPRSDGGALIVAEQYIFYVTTTTTRSSTGAVSTRTTYHYHYNNILVINVTPEGNIDWARKIPKKQYTVNDNGFYSSYAFVKSGKEMLFIYNDHKKNTKNRTPGDYLRYRGVKQKAMPVVASVDRDGKVDRKQIFNSKNKHATLRPKAHLQIDDDVILIQAIKGRKSQFVRLTFQ